MPRPAPKSSATNDPPQLVSGRWLLKAFGFVVLAALIFSYISLCLLYRAGQWQIVLHPEHAAPSDLPPTGLIHFGPDDSGQPQLSGEWISTGEGSHYNGLTVLLLPAGDGSRKDAQATVHALHDLGLNIFSFDYRGYGFSSQIHPSQQRMTEDAESAWQYLTGTRDVPAGKIIPYGIGTGASLAAHLAAKHHEVPAVILDRPHADLLEMARADKRSGILPAGLLFRERFPLQASLAKLSTPKLLLSTGSTAEPAFASAATPKMTVTLSTPDGQQFLDAVRRFVDQYAGSGK